MDMTIPCRLMLSLDFRNLVCVHMQERCAYRHSRSLLVCVDCVEAPGVQAANQHDCASLHAMHAP